MKNRITNFFNDYSSKEIRQYFATCMCPSLSSLMFIGSYKHNTCKIQELNLMSTKKVSTFHSGQIVIMRLSVYRPDVLQGELRFGEITNYTAYRWLVAVPDQIEILVKLSNSNFELNRTILGDIIRKMLKQYSVHCGTFSDAHNVNELDNIMKGFRKLGYRVSNSFCK